MKLPQKYRNFSSTAPSFMYFKPVLESPHRSYLLHVSELLVSVVPLLCEGLSCNGSTSKYYFMRQLVSGTTCKLIDIKICPV